MKSNRNKYRINEEVQILLDMQSYALGLASHSVHKWGISDLISTRPYHVNKKSHKLGLSKNRKPRVEIC